MHVMIFGDANVDVTVGWKDALSNMEEISVDNQRLLESITDISRTNKSDVEYYLSSQEEELSTFFNSLKPRIKFGGTGAIKAKVMADLGHNVSLYSWVGDDAHGKLILSELSNAGVDISHVAITGKTCETYNLFDLAESRVALSFWEMKQKLSDFKKLVKEKKPDAVFLTGAHRLKTSLDYASMPEAYVFAGSFAAYSPKEIEAKYNSDFSKGIIVANNDEIMQLSQTKDYLDGMKTLSNELIIVHGPLETAVKIGDRIVKTGTGELDRSKVVELTGIGDTWEATFIANICNLKNASDDEIIDAMKLASKAATARMLGK